MDQLPTELIQRITDHIDEQDLSSLRALRSVCRVLERQTSKAFPERCFRTRHLDTSVQSIDRLVKVMRCCPFASHIQSLIIDTRHGVRVDDSNHRAKMLELMSHFAAKTLNSIILTNSQDSEHHEFDHYVMDEEPYGFSHNNRYALFLQRSCILTDFAALLLSAMDRYGVKLLQFSVPREDDIDVRYAIGLRDFNGVPTIRQQGLSVFSALSHLELHFFPRTLASRAGTAWSTFDDALTLASCINSAQHLRTLKLSEQLEQFEGHEIETTIPNTLFQNLNVASVESFSFSDFRYPSWEALLVFCERHNRIRRLELRRMHIDAGRLGLGEAWSRVFECLKLVDSLQEFSWEDLDTTSTFIDYPIGLSHFDPRTCSHRRACDKQGCNGMDSYINCHRSGSVDGGHAAVEDVLTRMVENFKRPKIASAIHSS